LKPNINSVEVHPQLSNNRHPVDDALVGAGSLWPIYGRLCIIFHNFWYGHPWTISKTILKTTACFGLFACLDFGPCPLFLFLSLAWVLSFYDVWQGFIIKYNTYISMIQWYRGDGVCYLF
jgi:hypothetical protein